MVSDTNNSVDSNEEYDDLWIVEFLSHRENKYLERIHDSFLCDMFNFHGFREKIEDFESAYKAIQDIEESSNPETEAIVYLLTHQRYIYTKMGLDSILDRVINREFGTCYRIGCEGIPYVPTGLSSEPRKAMTKVFCYNCRSLYESRGALKSLDGCAWGVGFAHFLILSYPYHFERRKETNPYVPRIFGFKVLDRNDNDSI